MKRELSSFSFAEYQLLKNSGIFWEIYPEATGVYDEDVLNKKRG